MKEFHVNTEVYFGERALDRLAQLHYDRVFIVSDPFVVSSGMIKLVTDPLTRAGIAFDVFTDVVPDPPIEKVISGIAAVSEKKAPCIIAVGGDGTLHEVVNGLFIQQVVPPSEVLLAVIAVGSGNDWIRMFGIPQNCADAIRAIREEHSFLQDVGVVSYEEAKYRQSRYMVNVAGAGYEAQVVRCFNHLKKKGRRGRWLYTWSVIRSFFRYKPTGTKVWVDGKRVYNDLLLSIALGVGKYNGGGIQQLPDAVADDDMFDISLVRPIHFWHIIFRFHKPVSYTHLRAHET